MGALPVTVRQLMIILSGLPQGAPVEVWADQIHADAQTVIMVGDVARIQGYIQGYAPSVTPPDRPMHRPPYHRESIA